METAEDENGREICRWENFGKISRNISGKHHLKYCCTYSRTSILNCYKSDSNICTMYMLFENVQHRYARAKWSLCDPFTHLEKRKDRYILIFAHFFHGWIHQFNHFYRLVVSRSSPKCEEVGIHWGVGTKIRIDKFKSRYGWSQDSAMARIPKRIWAVLVFTRNQKLSPGPTAWWVWLHVY